jgi:hypothetical protein
VTIDENSAIKTDSTAPDPAIGNGDMKSMDRVNYITGNALSVAILLRPTTQRKYIAVPIAIILLGINGPKRTPLARTTRQP